MLVRSSNLRAMEVISPKCSHLAQAIGILLLSGLNDIWFTDIDNLSKPNITIG